MSNSDKPINLIQKAAERLRAPQGASLIERAVSKLQEQAASQPPATPPAEPPRAHERAAEKPAAQPSHTLLKPRISKQANIDLVRLQLAGMITPRGERSHISEEFRIIKRPLLLQAFSDEGRHQNAHLIMVSSARPGEGKTFTAVNLAMSIASEPDLNVLLVDADVHNPSVLPLLGLTAEHGLVDLLADENMDLSDVLIRIGNIPNLTVLPSGHPNPRTTEMLASHRMVGIVGDIARRYTDRVVIIDTPPVLASSEPSVIALHVGQALMVVEAEKTSQRAVESALSLLSKCPNINLLLNKSKISVGSEQFGSYSKYGYYAKKP